MGNGPRTCSIVKKHGQSVKLTQSKSLTSLTFWSSWLALGLDAWLALGLTDLEVSSLNDFTISGEKKTRARTQCRGLGRAPTAILCVNKIIEGNTSRSSRTLFLPPRNVLTCYRTFFHMIFWFHFFFNLIPIEHGMIGCQPPDNGRSASRPRR